MLPEISPAPWLGPRDGDAASVASAASRDGASFMSRRSFMSRVREKEREREKDDGASLLTPSVLEAADSSLCYLRDE